MTSKQQEEKSKQRKIRNSEYYDMQKTFDKLYADSKKGKVFYGCANYPNCDFVSWDMPLDEKCEKCGAYMVQRWGKNKRPYKQCSNPECQNRVFGNGKEKKETEGQDE